MFTLITGASSGVGRELAIYLSKKRHLILNGRNEERLANTRDACFIKPLIWKHDIAEVQTLEADFTAWVKEKNVMIDSFVHCAGLIKMIPIRAINLVTLNEVFCVNTYAPFLLTKTLAAKKINGKHLKSVVYISSNISNRGAAAFSAYGSSKAALDGLMRNLAVELAPDVRINSILPGGMITEMTKELFADESVKAKFERNYPLGIGTPASIAPMVEFLLSDGAAWITGQQLTIDGGRTIDITERRN